MNNSQNSKLKRVMCCLLSALTMLSGTAVAGTAMTTTASAAEVQTESSSAGEVTPATFSWDNATVYFLLTDRFENGNTSNDNAYGRQDINVGDQRATFHGGDFAGITKKINEGYFDDLGVNAIWLSAPYEQIHGYIVGGSNYFHYSYHGYYVLDYTETDAAFGTKEEFRTMVDTAHEHGIRIVLDIVMNHAGYNSLLDMSDYNFGVLDSTWESYYRNPSGTAEYHNHIDYKSGQSQWANWWGPDWIRCGVPGYTEEPGNDITRCLEGLPDFKTGSSTQVGLPNILKTKWSKEGTLSAKQSKYASSDTVTGYISTWLAEWVREFGVDGFRCDTAKHVELEAWGQLKTKCKAALKEWKSNNPTKKLDDLDFWMTGECWNHKVYKDGYYTTGGFDSMINFDGTGGGILAAGSVGQKYNDYANAINNDDSFNVLTYISSHDTTLARSDDMYYMGSAFLMLPGGVQIYYGDETARPKVSGVEDDSYKAGHCLRSDMNWSSYDKNLVKHWGIVGNFRKNHIAVGAGANVSLTATSGVAFGRTYSKNGLEDKVAAVIGAGSNSDVTVDVSSIWSDGTVLENYYDESTAVVSGGKVTFNSGAHGTILIQEPDGERGRVVVTHIDQDTGKTIKTVTLSGLVGDSYTAEALDTPGFAVARVVGSKTGTFAKDEASVTFYYTFDSNNYAYIVVKHVDASTGAELADSETQVGKIGTTYTTSSKDIKNYECDESLTTNSTGTVVKGTTTVTYKYNYVEPKNLQVHYYNSNSWSAVNMYAYTGDGASAVKLLGEWPGKAMTSEGDGWFFCEVPDNETAKVLFNNGNGAQEPGSQQPGYELTGEVWLKNGKTCPACKVNVKYVSTDGKVLGTEVIKGIADGTATYTTTAKTFSGYTLESTPANATGKFTEGTISVVYTYKSTEPIYDTLINNTSVSASTVKVGNIIKMTGAATGGSGSYTYKFYYKKSSASSWSAFGSAYVTATTATLSPSSAGTFNLKSVVTDSVGKTAEKTFTVTFEEKVTALTNKSTVTATSASVGTAVTIKGAASGGTGSYIYEFYYKKQGASSWSTFGSGNRTATTATLKPSAAGTFIVRVYAKDSNQATDGKDFTITFGNVELKNNCTASAASVEPGTAVTIKGAASGGTGGYTYQFYYKKQGADSWSKFDSNYQTATTATLKASSAGTFIVRTYVKDSSGKSVKKDITIQFTGPLANKSTVTSTNPSVGTAVTIKGAASGGTGSYTYQFYYKKKGADSWSKFGSNYQTATTATLKASSAGTFIVRTYAKDGKSSVAKDFTITFGTAPLSNNTSVTTSTPKVGTAVTIKGAASGGTGGYTYQFYYKKSSDSSWSTFGSNYQTATTATLKASSAGNFDVRVYVKDSSGKTAVRNFMITFSK